MIKGSCCVPASARKRIAEDNPGKSKQLACVAGFMAEETIGNEVIMTEDSGASQRGC